MVAEAVASLRRQHRRLEPSPVLGGMPTICRYCGVPWPCRVMVVVDALNAANRRADASTEVVAVAQEFKQAYPSYGTQYPTTLLGKLVLAIEGLDAVLGEARQ